jgi:predicted DsbA family dithiol-disulfide isomerase
VIEMQIDIFQDTVCPWCRIGKQNLLQALEGWQGEAVQLRFRAFMLDTTIPPAGLPFRETMAKKFGASTNMDSMFAQVTQAGKAAGLKFDFSRVEYMPNTLLSHQVIALAPQELQLLVVEAINRAYFEEGKNIGDPEVLLTVAAQAGMKAEVLREQITAKKGLDEVEQDLSYAGKVGITGVPFFILNNQYAISGAQPPDVLHQAMEQAQG